MQTTSASLLLQLRQPAREAAWGRFVRLYTPLLHGWACRMGLQEADASDLVQDVFIVLVKKLPEFNYERCKSFRGWLRVIIRNKWRERLRCAVLPTDSGHELDQLPGPEGEAFWESDYREYLVGLALRIVQQDFQPATWQAFWEHVVKSKPASQVAAEQGLTSGAVYAAKVRILARLREELDGAIND
jgi:RNA polymerase sigma-70 factor (ECF subfamily)